jgi:hypothetical protein
MFFGHRKGRVSIIKLLYAIQDIITLMVILDTSETWNDGHNPTFRESYLEDDNGEILASGNAPYEKKGNGNGIIIGHEDALGASKNFRDGH